MDNFKGLAHIGLHTTDIEISKKFYCENFDFKLIAENKIEKPGNAWLKIAFIDLNGMMLELLQPSDSAIIKKGNSGCIDHLAIEAKDIDGEVKKLKQKGIVFETDEPLYMEKLFRGVKVIFFRGPSEERLELFEYLA